MEYSIDSYYTENDDVFMIFKNNKNKKVEVNLKRDFPEYCCNPGTYLKIKTVLYV